MKTTYKGPNKISAEEGRKSLNAGEDMMGRLQGRESSPNESVVTDYIKDVETPSTSDTLQQDLPHMVDRDWKAPVPIFNNISKSDKERSSRRGEVLSRQRHSSVGGR